MSGQLLEQQVGQPNLSVDPVDYFGVDPDRAENSDRFGITPDPGRDQELYRVSYLFLLVFGNEESSTDYGGMQLRAETFLWLENGGVPVRLQKIIQNAAHRAAYIYDSSIETPAYGANEWGPGYLSGFDPWENGYEYDNWEIEPVARGEVHTHPGVIDWSTEVYLEVDGTQYANLSGVASGLADPWTLTIREVAGRDAVHVPPTKWQIGWEQSRRDGDGEYYVRPEPYSQASERYREGAGAGKTVYINGQPIGGLEGKGGKGRAWLAPEYGRGDPRFTKGGFGRYWSRQGLLEGEDGEAPPVEHYQALQSNAKLYQTGETEEAIYLRTRRALPDDWQATDPDEVPVHLEVQEGQPARTIYVLGLDDPDDALLIECREDREVIDHLGLSKPPYRHPISAAFRHPGFREVEPHHISGGGGRGADPGQSDLGDSGGEGQT
jgi:hypothetical protein